jgi:hypothetical protein
VTASDIVDIIQISDLKKASGPDKISHKMLKISPKKIAEPLQIIFNKSLRQQLMMLPCLSLFAFFDANNFQTI